MPNRRRPAASNAPLINELPTEVPAKLQRAIGVSPKMRSRLATDVLAAIRFYQTCKTFDPEPSVICLLRLSELAASLDEAIKTANPIAVQSFTAEARQRNRHRLGDHRKSLQEFSLTVTDTLRTLRILRRVWGREKPLEPADRLVITLCEVIANYGGI